MHKINPDTCEPFNAGDALTQRADRAAQGAARDGGRAREAVLSGALPDGYYERAVDNMRAAVSGDGFRADDAVLRAYVDRHPQRVEPARVVSYVTLPQPRLLDRWRNFCARNSVFIPFFDAAMKAALLATWFFVFWFFWTGTPA